MIHGESLAAVAGQVQGTKSEGRSQEGPLGSPGWMPKHYSPKAKLVEWSWRDEAELRWQLAGVGCPGSAVHVIAHTRIPSGQNLGRVSVLPRDPAAFGRAIYAELHLCDEGGAQLIVVEALPQTLEWQAIADRLQRAAG